MSDPEPLLDEARNFAAHPPVSPPPVEQVAQRAARRRRRRRVAGAGLAVVLGGMAAGAVAVSTSDEPRGEEVRTVDDPTPPASDGLRVRPDTDLSDGQEVAVTGPFDPGAVVGVGQCASEAAEARDPVPWCDINVARSETEGGNGLVITVVRTIETTHGLIDCAERPGRCLIGVRTNSGDLLGPISFRDTGPAPRAALEADRTEVADGEAISLTGSGFGAAQEVYVTQCVEGPTHTELARCDQARTARLTTDHGGRFELRFLTYAEVLTIDGWSRCDPCVVRASRWRQAPAVMSISVSVAPGSTAVRPTVAIVPGGPYEPGARVTLEGSGFQPADEADLEVGWCSFVTDHPEREIQGDPAHGHTACRYPEEGFTPTVDEDGRFTIERYPLPEDCDAGRARCGLAWHPFEGSLPVFVTLFELRR